MLSTYFMEYMVRNGVNLANKHQEQQQHLYTFLNSVQRLQSYTNNNKNINLKKEQQSRRQFYRPLYTNTINNNINDNSDGDSSTFNNLQRNQHFYNVINEVVISTNTEPFRSPEKSSYGIVQHSIQHPIMNDISSTAAGGNHDANGDIAAGADDSNNLPVTIKRLELSWFEFVLPISILMITLLGILIIAFVLYLWLKQNLLGHNNNNQNISDNRRNQYNSLCRRSLLCNSKFLKFITGKLGDKLTEKSLSMVQYTEQKSKPSINNIQVNNNSVDKKMLMSDRHYSDLNKQLMLTVAKNSGISLSTESSLLPLFTHYRTHPVGLAENLMASTSTVSTVIGTITFSIPNSIVTIPVPPLLIESIGSMMSKTLNTNRTTTISMTKITNAATSNRSKCKQFFSIDCNSSRNINTNGCYTRPSCNNNNNSKSSNKLNSNCSKNSSKCSDNNPLSSQSINMPLNKIPSVQHHHRVRKIHQKDVATPPLSSTLKKFSFPAISGTASAIIEKNSASSSSTTKTTLSSSSLSFVSTTLQQTDSPKKHDPTTALSALFSVANNSNNNENVKEISTCITLPTTSNSNNEAMKFSILDTSTVVAPQLSMSSAISSTYDVSSVADSGDNVSVGGSTTTEILSLEQTKTNRNNSSLIRMDDTQHYQYLNNPSYYNNQHSQQQHNVRSSFAWSPKMLSENKENTIPVTYTTIIGSNQQTVNNSPNAINKIQRCGELSAVALQPNNSPKFDDYRGGSGSGSSSGTNHFTFSPKLIQQQIMPPTTTPIIGSDYSSAVVPSPATVSATMVMATGSIIGGTGSSPFLINSANYKYGNYFRFPDVDVFTPTTVSSHLGSSHPVPSLSTSSTTVSDKLSQVKSSLPVSWSPSLNTLPLVSLPSPTLPLVTTITATTIMSATTPPIPSELNIDDDEIDIELIADNAVDVVYYKDDITAGNNEQLLPTSIDSLQIERQIIDSNNIGSASSNNHNIKISKAKRRARLKSISLDSDGAKLVEENLGIPVEELIDLNITAKHTTSVATPPDQQPPPPPPLPSPTTYKVYQNDDNRNSKILSTETGRYLKNKNNLSINLNIHDETLLSMMMADNGEQTAISFTDKYNCQKMAIPSTPKTPTLMQTRQKAISLDSDPITTLPYPRSIVKYETAVILQQQQQPSFVYSVSVPTTPKRHHSNSLNETLKLSSKTTSANDYLIHDRQFQPINSKGYSCNQNLPYDQQQQQLHHHYHRHHHHHYYQQPICSQKYNHYNQQQQSSQQKIGKINLSKMLFNTPVSSLALKQYDDKTKLMSQQQQQTQHHLSTTATTAQSTVTVKQQAIKSGHHVFAHKFQNFNEKFDYTNMANDGATTSIGSSSGIRDKDELIKNEQTQIIKSINNANIANNTSTNNNNLKTLLEVSDLEIRKCTLEEPNNINDGSSRKNNFNVDDDENSILRTTLQESQQLQQKATGGINYKNRSSSSSSITATIQRYDSNHSLTKFSELKPPTTTKTETPITVIGIANNNAHDNLPEHLIKNSSGSASLNASNYSLSNFQGSHCSLTCLQQPFDMSLSRNNSVGNSNSGGGAAAAASASSYGGTSGGGGGGGDVGVGAGVGVGVGSSSISASGGFGNIGIGGGSKKNLLQRRGSNTSLSLNIQGSCSSLNRFNSHSSLNISHHGDMRATGGLSMKKGLLERRNSNASLTLNIQTRALSVSNCNLHGSECSLSSSVNTNNMETLSIGGASGVDCGNSSGGNIEDTIVTATTIQQTATSTTTTMTTIPSYPIDRGRIQQLPSSSLLLSPHHRQRRKFLSSENLHNFSICPTATQMELGPVGSSQHNKSNYHRYNQHPLNDLQHNHQHNQQRSHHTNHQHHHSSASDLKNMPSLSNNHHHHHDRPHHSQHLVMKNIDDTLEFACSEQRQSNHHQRLTPATITTTQTATTFSSTDGHIVDIACGDVDDDDDDDDEDDDCDYCCCNYGCNCASVRNITTKPLSPQTTSEDFKIYLANIQMLQNATNPLSERHLTDLHYVFVKSYQPQHNTNAAPLTYRSDINDDGQSITTTVQISEQKEQVPIQCHQQLQLQKRHPSSPSLLMSGQYFDINSFECYRNNVIDRHRSGTIADNFEDNVTKQSFTIQQSPTPSTKITATTTNIPSDNEQKMLLRNLHQEFWDLPTNYQEKPLVFGSQAKNRYKTILPNEHSRVMLNVELGQFHEPYINANYIRGPDYTQNNYIATQGPMPNTIYEFWLMAHQNVFKKIQQHKQQQPESNTVGGMHTLPEMYCQKIAMLTDIIENSRPKCSVYFPQKVNEIMVFSSTGNADDNAIFQQYAEPLFAYGEQCATTMNIDDNNDDSRNLNEKYSLNSMECNYFIVKNLGIIVRNGYSIRKLCVLYLNRHQQQQHGQFIENVWHSRIYVYHYWFPDWPDHRSPHDINVLLDMSLDLLDGKPLQFTVDSPSTQSQSFNLISIDVPVQPLPIIHCSAGIGRTGCLAAILNGLRQMRTNARMQTQTSLNPTELLQEKLSEINDNAHNDGDSGTVLIDNKANANHLDKITQVNIDSTINICSSNGDKNGKNSNVSDEILALDSITATVASTTNPIIATTTTATTSTTNIATTAAISEMSVDVLGIVCNLRLQRGGMVQNSEQYELIHRALCLYQQRLQWLRTNKIANARHQDQCHL